MITVILVIHLLIAIAMVALILLQRSEGGALGIGGSGGGPGVMSGRAAGNLLTRSTGVLAAAFMVTSMTLAILASNGDGESSVLDTAPVEAEAGDPLRATPETSGPSEPVAPMAAPVTAPMATDGATDGATIPAPVVPNAPAVPSAPLAE